MYIYDIPYDIENELCRLLDNDDVWRELAGTYMKYSAFEINEIDQTARRQAISPTSQLLTLWGQLNHKVEELFVLLHKMKHIPALNCIKSLVNERYQKLLGKHSRSGVREKATASVDENGNRPPPPKCTTQSSSVPIPVMLIQQGQLTFSNRPPTESTAPPDESSSVEDSSSADRMRPRTDEDADMIKQCVSAIPALKYEELRDATNNWSESNVLGRGGFGQVYKGEWKLLMVAVKRLNNNDKTNRELIREMALNQYRHDNILPLYGYSLGGPNACLVYQLMAGGSLQERLRCRTQHPPLTWTQRHRIAHGVARGLQFLHTMTGSPLIHGDIKPANILLDQCTIPKIGDFGLARQGPYGEDRTHMRVSRVHGTRPYLPDEYLRSRCLSPAVDVFSFGVVALELASALAPLDRARASPLLPDHARLRRAAADTAVLEDRIIAGTNLSNPVLCREFIEIGLHCTESQRAQRPTMLQVYRKLDSMDIPGKNNYL